MLTAERVCCGTRSAGRCPAPHMSFTCHHLSILFVSSSMFFLWHTQLRDLYDAAGIRAQGVVLRTMPQSETFSAVFISVISGRSVRSHHHPNHPDLSGSAS